jgi:Peptidase family S41
MGPRFRGDDTDFHSLGWAQAYGYSPADRPTLKRELSNRGDGKAGSFEVRRKPNRSRKVAKPPGNAKSHPRQATRGGQAGGDALPWYFRKLAIGPIVGEKTWGGLIGIGGYPSLLDNGYVMAPRWAIYGLKGEWEVENHGIKPDIEVAMDPKAVREGHDPQLEKAVETVMELLKQHPIPEYPKPAYPDYHPVMPSSP